MGTKCERGRGRGIISFVSTRVSNQIYIVENESRNGFSPIIKHIQENTRETSRNCDPRFFITLMEAAFASLLIRKNLFPSF